jgi:hypothetical protein
MGSGRVESRIFRAILAFLVAFWALAAGFARHQAITERRPRESEAD